MTNKPVDKNTRYHFTESSWLLVPVLNERFRLNWRHLESRARHDKSISSRRLALFQSPDD